METPSDSPADLFRGRAPEEQTRILAELERGGAAVYRVLAEHEQDAGRAAELRAGAEREEANAATLETLGASPA